MRNLIFIITMVSLLFQSSGNVMAQVSSMPFSVTQETFDVITGTPLESYPPIFQNVYNNIPIGFSFSYAGGVYSEMIVARCGFISLAPTSSGNAGNLFASSTRNIAAWASGSLECQRPTSSLQYITTGVAPNRVCIIQWLHYSVNNCSSMDVSFQIRLYETSNCIKFVYDSLFNVPVYSYIGLNGNSYSDHIVLESTGCDLTTAGPAASNTTPFSSCPAFVNTPGVAFNFGPANGFNPANFGYITGKVFDDVNNNGSLDPNEPGVSNNRISILPDSGKFVVTDGNGDYTFFFTDSSLTYSLTSADFSFWNNYNSGTVSCNPSNQACSGVNIGVHHSALPKVADIPFSVAQDTFHLITGIEIGSYMYNCNGSMLNSIYYHDLPIGFDFSFNGTTHDTLNISSSGYITLGHLPANAMAIGNSLLLSGATPDNTISALNFTLVNTLGNASLQYVTLGTVPNRVFIAQWLNYSLGSFCGEVNFQIQLYESSNSIRFVYGQFNVPAGAVFKVNAGLKGTGDHDVKVVVNDSLCHYCYNNDPYYLGTCAAGPTCHMENATADTSKSHAVAWNGVQCVAGSNRWDLKIFSPPTPGLAYTFGSVPNSPFAGSGYITGKVFNDMNSNGLFDAGESGIPYRIVHMMPGNYYVTADAGGDYIFFFTDSTQTYTLDCQVANWNQTSYPTVWNCTPASQSCGGLNFGFHAIPNVHDMAVTSPNWYVNPMISWPQYIFYQNNGTVVEQDTVEVVLDPLYTYLGSYPNPISVNGQTIKWAFHNLQPFDFGTISVGLDLNSSAIIGNYVNSTLAVGPINTDSHPTDNVAILHQLISGAWDPNEMIAEPAGMIPPGTTINYSIHFQNTGNAQATNVFVYDTLDTNLDLQTFQFLGTSHPSTYSIDQNRVLKFSFYNIHLPDSASDFAGSNGTISYSVKVKDGLPPLTVINGKAGIVFDWNQAVITNTVADTIQLVTGINENAYYYSNWTLYPNPTVNNIVHVISKKIMDKAKLSISSVQGQVIIEKLDISGKEIIDIGQLTAGIYVCTIQSEKLTQIFKLVKKN